MQFVAFVETSVFSRKISGLLNDASLAEFQTELARNPEKGAVIEGAGGLGKVRWKLPGKGKSGGIRVIYLYLKLRGRIYLVFVFAKMLNVARDTEISWERGRRTPSGAALRLLRIADSHPEHLLQS